MTTKPIIPVTFTEAILDYPSLHEKTSYSYKGNPPGEPAYSATLIVSEAEVYAMRTSFLKNFDRISFDCQPEELKLMGDSVDYFLGRATRFKSFSSQTGQKTYKGADGNYRVGVKSFRDIEVGTREGDTLYLLKHPEQIVKELYAGCKVEVVLNASLENFGDPKKISLYIQGVYKVGDGEEIERQHGDVAANTSFGSQIKETVDRPYTPNWGDKQANDFDDSPAPSAKKSEIDDMLS